MTTVASIARSERALVYLSRWRVNAATVLGAAVIVFARPTRPAILAFLPLVLLGVALRVWARGHLDRHHHVTQTGPYRFVRHPLYIGSFAMGLGFACMTGFWFVPPLFVLLYFGSYVPKGLREETFLRGRYGDEYTGYAERVGALWPRLHPAPLPAGARRFAWQRVLGHREWKTWLGVLAALALLWVRATTATP
jgi:protein-S-isoprenylcysteine O-methyltransferase Ste14